MKRIIILFCLVCTAAAAVAQATLVNDENAEVRTLSSSFSAVKISGGIDLFLTQGSEEGLVVSASKDKYREYIKTEVKEGVLHIYYSHPDGAVISLNTYNKKLRAYVAFKNLEKITASGACDIRTTGTITVSALAIKLSGACDFKGEVKVNELNADLSGASDIKISGTATNASLEASGASDIKCYDLVTENCKVSASGASDVSITVNKELSVTASGASDVHYKGACVIKEMRSNGASNIGRRG